MLITMMGVVLALTPVETDCPSDVAATVDLAEIADVTGASPDQVQAAVTEFSSLSYDGGYAISPWQAWLIQRDQAEDPVVACLFALVAQEQYGRLWFSALYSSDQTVDVAQPEVQVMARVTSALDVRNREWLRETVTTRGWFRISEYGEYADAAAWLIVQHADLDVEFQREMRALLDPIAAEGDMRASSYAMLTDRVAVNSGEPQRYGSQGRCVGRGQWDAFPYTGTFEEMDARRESVGLEHHAAYVSRMSERCSADRQY